MTDERLPFSTASLSVADFRALLSSASHGWSLERFCAVLGWEVDGYADRKFREFQALGLLLERFEPETLRQAMNGYLTERQQQRFRSGSTYTRLQLRSEEAS